MRKNNVIYMLLITCILGFSTYELNAQTALSNDSLPLHITSLTDFGQRPEWSIDGKQIYFLDSIFF